MDRDAIVNAPAVVRPAEDLGELAAVANAGYQRGEDAARQGIEHYIAAGEALAKAKKLCGHGRWLEWVQKNLRFGDRQARKLMRLFHERDRLKSESDSDLTIDGAARALAGRDDEEETPLPPVLRPGYVYFCEGTDAAGGPAFGEVAAWPDAPAYWVSAFAFERGEYVDYCGRGMRLEGPEGLARLAGRHGFVPDPDGWREFPYDPSLPPLAIAFDLLDRRQCRGWYDWYADMPPESREATIQAVMRRWGITKEPREGPGSIYLGRPAEFRRSSRPGGRRRTHQAPESPLDHSDGQAAAADASRPVPPFSRRRSIAGDERPEPESRIAAVGGAISAGLPAATARGASQRSNSGIDFLLADHQNSGEDNTL